jgi:PhnB protein
MARHPIPEDQTAAVPYLSVHDGAAAIAFYVRAFGAVEGMRLAEPSGRIGHAELSIGRAKIMLADEYPELGFVGPKTVGNTTVSISMFVEDVDEVLARAVEAGATVERPARDEFFGYRVATVRDPFGHRWTLSTRIEEVSPEEIQRRMSASGQ